MPFTAFTNRRKEEQVTARLIVRRVRRLNPASAPGADQGELFAAYRHHCCFTDSPMPMLQAESQHRGHAIVEQVHADLKNGPLAALPSGSFAANSAWLVLAVIAFNLTRAVGALASLVHARATSTTRARPADLRARPARLLGPPAGHAPTAGLALGTGLAANVHRRGERAARRRLTPAPRPPRARPETNVDKPEQAGRILTSPQETQDSANRF